MSAQVAKQRLEELISFTGVNVDAKVDVTDDGINLVVESTPASPRLIGHRGETLRAIEYLVNQMVKAHDGEAPRVFIDIAGYKEARRHTLEELAREVAERVISGNVTEELPPMNPAERRIIHMTLREISGVISGSSGEGRGRHIVVSPADLAAPADTSTSKDAVSNPSIPSAEA